MRSMWPGGELIALALAAPSPVAAMLTPIHAHRAVEHFALLGPEGLIERFESRLRRLQSLSARGGHSAEIGLPLNDGRVRARPKRALLAERALLPVPRVPTGETGGRHIPAASAHRPRDAATAGRAG